MLICVLISIIFDLVINTCLNEVGYLMLSTGIIVDIELNQFDLNDTITKQNKVIWTSFGNCVTVTLLEIKHVMLIYVDIC